MREREAAWAGQLTPATFARLDDKFASPSPVSSNDPGDTRTTLRDARAAQGQHWSGGSGQSPPWRQHCPGVCPTSPGRSPWSFWRSEPPALAAQSSEGDAGMGMSSGIAWYPGMEQPKVLLARALSRSLCLSLALMTVASSDASNP